MPRSGQGDHQTTTALVWRVLTAPPRLQPLLCLAWQRQLVAPNSHHPFMHKEKSEVLPGPVATRNEGCISPLSLPLAVAKGLHFGQGDRSGHMSQLPGLETSTSRKMEQTCFSLVLPMSASKTLDII